jgi:uncharacterized repeat protein (TIGR01451 family)
VTGRSFKTGSSGLLLTIFVTLTALVVTLPGLVSVADAACVCGNGDGIPIVNYTINVDSNMADWAAIHADQDNNVCDSTSGQLGERDGNIQSTGRDVTHFAWTYDSTNVFFYTERFGSASNTQTFLYYADVNNDGFMTNNEPVIGVKWKGSNRQVDVYLSGYVPVDAVNGDATVDSQGFGDGYALPGTLQNVTGPVAPLSGKWGAINGLSMEFGVRWTDLGFSGPVGHTIHVSSTNTNLGAASLGSQIDDNLGGCGGGAGSTQFADLSFASAYSLYGQRSATVWGIHHLVNLGNGDDVFAFASSITGTHSPTVTYWIDADSDSAFDASSDTPIASTVGLASGGSTDIIIVYDINGLATAGTAIVATTATSQFNTSQSATVTDYIEAQVPNISILKWISSVVDAAGHTTVDKALPGAVVTYNGSATNSGNGYAENDSIVLTDVLPAGVELQVGTGAASPVTINAGTSTLTYNFSSWASTADDIAFTSDNGASPAYTYTPADPDADQYDPAIRGFRINPKGTFDASSSFTFIYRVRIE